MKKVFLLKTSVWCRNYDKQIQKYFDTKKELVDFCIKNNLCFAFDTFEIIDNKKAISIWRCF